MKEVQETEYTKDYKRISDQERYESYLPLRKQYLDNFINVYDEFKKHVLLISAIFIKLEAHLPSHLHEGAEACD